MGLLITNIIIYMNTNNFFNQEKNIRSEKLKNDLKLKIAEKQEKLKKLDNLSEEELGESVMVLNHGRNTVRNFIPLFKQTLNDEIKKLQDTLEIL